MEEWRMTGKQGREGKMKDDRKAEKRKQNEGWQKSRKEKAEWERQESREEKAELKDEGKKRENRLLEESREDMEEWRIR